jgi:hypothetical protein
VETTIWLLVRHNFPPEKEKTTTKKEVFIRSIQIGIGLQ